MKVDVPKKVLISEYKWLYENKKTSLSRICDTCPIGKYKHFPRDIYIVGHTTFSACGCYEYDALKKYIPTLSLEKFAEITGGKSIFCSKPAYTTLYEAAEKLLPMIIKRNVKI
jgi:hypothetical protein